MDPVTGFVYVLFTLFCFHLATSCLWVCNNVLYVIGLSLWNVAFLLKPSNLTMRLYFLLLNSSYKIQQRTNLVACSFVSFIQARHNVTLIKWRQVYLGPIRWYGFQDKHANHCTSRALHKQMTPGLLFCPSTIAITCGHKINIVKLVSTRGNWTVCVACSEELCWI